MGEDLIVIKRFIGGLLVTLVGLFFIAGLVAQQGWKNAAGILGAVLVLFLMLWFGIKWLVG